MKNVLLYVSISDEILSLTTSVHSRKFEHFVTSDSRFPGRFIHICMGMVSKYSCIKIIHTEGVPMSNDKSYPNIQGIVRTFPFKFISVTLDHRDRPLSISVGSFKNI